MIITNFYTILPCIPYKRDNKFNRNTLKLNSLSPKVLNSHIFPPRNINSYQKQYFVSYIIRSYVNEHYDAYANCELEGSPCSPLEHGALSSETSVFHFAEAGVNSNWRSKLSRSLCLHYYFISNSNIFFTKAR